MNGYHGVNFLNRTFIFSIGEEFPASSLSMGHKNSRLVSYYVYMLVYM